MKNIHVVPTDKPSRLYINLLDYLSFDSLQLRGSNQNIYITSDKEIKEGDWFMSDFNSFPLHNIKELSEREGTLGWKQKDLKNNLKIILTTDQDLIKDGVWGIEDGFLEWFVKNPTCEYVELKGYAIILPGESCDCDNICGECEPKQERMYSEEDLDSFRKFMIQEQNFSKSCLDVFVKQNKNK